jgi:PAS domain S-box-containing protein
VNDVRVLVAEDEQPLLAAIRDLIEGEDGLQFVGAASDADAVIELARTLHPDVALLDMRMPGGGGPRAAREIRAASPDTRVVALSAFSGRASVLEMLGAGAIAYLVKGESPAEIVEAIRRAARGQSSLSGEMASEIAGGMAFVNEERDRAEEELRRREARFRALLESAPDGLAIIDANGSVVMVNRQIEALFGYPREQLVGQSIDILLPTRFRDRHLRHRSSYFADPSTRSMGAGLELAGLRRDGSEFPVDISLSSIETEEGPLAIAFVRDITERIASETLRRRGEERFEALLESAPDAVVIVDSEGTILFVNEQTENLFDYARDELRGRPVDLLLPERFHSRHPVHRQKYMADPRTRPMGVGLELAGRRKDGTEFPVDISLSVLETDEGPVATAFVRDVTDRQARGQLERDLAARRTVLSRLVAAEEEERRRIAADIHDDSIQAMTAAGMRLQILRRLLDDPEQLRRLDDLEGAIGTSIARLRHLLFELRPIALDQEGLVAALQMYLDDAEAESGTTYVLEAMHGSDPPGETRIVLYRIAREILTNVRKHARAATATVTVGGRDGGYFLGVRDDGVGFGYDRDAPSRPGHLGLPTIRERAELAGGWIRVESSVGEGTNVEVWIPRIEVAADGAGAGIAS